MTECGSQESGEMPDSLGGEMRLDDEHEKVDDFVKHRCIEVVGAQSEEQLANNICRVLEGELFISDEE